MIGRMYSWSTFAHVISGLEEARLKSLWSLLYTYYTLPRRHYHTLDEHIAECLLEFRKFEKYVPRAEVKWHEVEAAIWFHDIYCFPQDPLNESKSAELAKALLYKTSLDTDLIGQIIMATKESLPPQNRTDFDIHCKIMADVDLVSLAASKPDFQKNTENIRRELGFPKDFDSMVSNFFIALLNRGYIYHLPFFKANYEYKAKKNIEDTLKRIEKT